MAKRKSKKVEEFEPTEDKEYLDVDVDEEAIPKAKSRKGRPKGAKTVNKRKANQWMVLIKKIKSENPGMSHKEAMKIASKVASQHGSSAAAMEASGAGLSFRDIASKLGSVIKGVAKAGKKVVTSDTFKEGAKSAFEAAKPALTMAAVETVGRAEKRLTGKRSSEEQRFGDIAKKGAKDLGKDIARQGMHHANEQLMQRLPKEAHPTLRAVTGAINKRIEQRIGTGVVGEYMRHCDHCAEQGGSGFLPVLAALAPTIIPMAADLISGLLGKILGKRGKGFEEDEGVGGAVPGDYSSNELGSRPGQAVHHNQDGGFFLDVKGIPSMNRENKGQGGSILEGQRSDAPLSNVFVKHSSLWQFAPVPGLMGIIETPANSFYGSGTSDENLGIWEMANDVDQYINSAPTFEDGITSIAPSTLVVNPASISEMPKNTTIGSTVKAINGEGRGGGSSDTGDRGFVYAPGMSLSRLAAYSSRYGNGIVGSMSIHAGKGGDITRVGRGILPTESAITGVPVGVGSRGRGVTSHQQGGSHNVLVRASNVASWS